jgi:hypothetical protein
MNAVTYTEVKMPSGLKAWSRDGDSRYGILRIKNRFGSYYFEARYMTAWQGLVFVGDYKTFDDAAAALAKVGA